MNAYTKEKIYSRAGIKFGDRAGVKVIVRKALYGLKGSANAWWLQLSDDLRSMGFTRSRIDLSIWYKKRQDGTGYDYIATLVDDFIIIADEPQIYLDEFLAKEYVISGGAFPDLYVGQDIRAYRDLSGIYLGTKK